VLLDFFFLYYVLRVRFVNNKYISLKLVIDFLAD